MKSTLRRCWLGLASLLLTAGFGCGDGNDVKVTLTHNGAQVHGTVIMID